MCEEEVKHGWLVRTVVSYLVKTYMRKCCCTKNFVSNFFLYPGRILCLSVHFSTFFFAVLPSQLLEGVHLYETKRLRRDVNHLVFCSLSLRKKRILV